jgi:hypothetical protein
MPMRPPARLIFIRSIARLFSCDVRSFLLRFNDSVEVEGSRFYRRAGG